MLSMVVVDVDVLFIDITCLCRIFLNLTRMLLLATLLCLPAGFFV